MTAGPGVCDLFEKSYEIEKECKEMSCTEFIHVDFPMFDRSSLNTETVTLGPLAVKEESKGSFVYKFQHWARYHNNTTNTDRSSAFDGGMKFIIFIYDFVGPMRR